MPPDSMHSAARLLDDLRAAGEGDSEGQFTLDAPSALAKLERYQLAHPEEWILAVVSSAVAAGATVLTVTARARGWSIRFDARLTLLETLPQMLPAPLGSAHDAQQRAVLDLSSAIHEMMVAGAVRVIVESGHTRVEVGDGGYRMTGIERTVATNTRIEIASNWKQTLYRGLHAFSGTDPRDERVLLAQRCRWAPLVIHFNRATVGASDFHPTRAIMWRKLVPPPDAEAGARLTVMPPDAPYHDEVSSPAAFSAILAISPQSTGCTLLINGVAYPHRRRHLAIGNVTCVAAVPWLELDLSRGEIVDNDDYRAIMEMLQDQVEDMVLEMSRDLSRLSRGDQERMLRVFLEEEKRLRGRKARSSSPRYAERERLLHAAGHVLLAHVSVESNAYVRLLDQLHQLYKVDMPPRRQGGSTASRLGLTALLKRVEEGVLRYVRCRASTPMSTPPETGTPPTIVPARTDERRLALLDCIADIRRSALGAHHRTLVRSLRDIAILRTLQDEFWDALRAIDEAIAIEARRPADARDALARLHEIRGLVLRAAGRLDEGATAHLEAYALRQQYPVRVPSMMAHSLLMLGDVFLARGERDPAEQMYVRTLDSGPLEPWLETAACEAQADVLRLGADNERAADVLARALRAYTPGTPDERILIADRIHLLRVLSPRRRERAKPPDDSAADRCTRALDQGARLVDRLGYRLSARGAYQQALQTAHATHGKFHAHWSIAASRLAYLLRTLNRGGEADLLIAQQRLVALANQRRQPSMESPGRRSARPAQGSEETRGS